MKEDLFEREKKDSAEKDEMKKELKKEIDELSKQATAKELLKFIYKKYPPVIKSHTLDKDFEKKSIKKTLSIAILHYHPDKVDSDTQGLRKKVLYEEITKVLTKFFNEIKMP